MPQTFLGKNLTHNLQEAEQAAYSNTQVAAGQAVANAPAQSVQPTATTSAADAGAMEVDENAPTQEPAGEGHGGVKRKAGEDAEPASKKLRMGMLVTLFYAPTADATIACRTGRCSFEEVNPTDASLMVQLLTRGYRDRENCTVFVSNLPETAAEDDLKALFKDVRSHSHFVRKQN